MTPSNKILFCCTTNKNEIKHLEENEERLDDVGYDNDFITVLFRYHNLWKKEF